MTLYLLRNLKEAMREFFSEIGHTHNEYATKEELNAISSEGSGNNGGGNTSNCATQTQFEETQEKITLLMKLFGIDCAPEDIIVIEDGDDLQGYNQYGAQVIALHYHQGDYVYVKSDGKLYYVEVAGENGKCKIINDNINAPDIQDTLDSDDTDKPLSANQGKILKNNIDAIKNHNTDWIQGTLINGNGALWGMIRNGFAIVKFNVTTGAIPNPRFALGQLPKTFYAHGGAVEGTTKTYKDSWSKVSTVIVDNNPNETLFSIYNESTVEAGTGFVGLIIYPVADY